MTIKELRKALKEYEEALAKCHEVNCRILTEDKIPDSYYRFRDLMLKKMEDIGNIEIGG